MDFQSIETLSKKKILTLFRMTKTHKLFGKRPWITDLVKYKSFQVKKIAKVMMIHSKTSSKITSPRLRSIDMIPVF